MAPDHSESERRSLRMRLNLPLALFVLALVVAAMLYGLAAAQFHYFPSEIFRSATLTADTMIWRLISDEANRPAQFLHYLGQANAASVTPGLTQEPHAANSAPILVYGGAHQHLDLCPEHGCIAVIYAADGEVARTYPYRPDEIFSAHANPDLPHETVGFRPELDARVMGIERYADGDLLVVFQYRDAFPYAGAVARIDAEGRPVWVRKDYSHHWPTLLPSGVALVPGLDVGTAPFTFALTAESKLSLECESGKPVLDRIRYLDPDGQAIREIPVLERLAESEFRAVLQHTTDGCDPIHLNFIAPADRELAAAVDYVNEGDLILSLRNISALAILDPATGRFRKLIKGDFYQQHSARLLRDSRVVLFDNQGSDANGGPSRVVALDLTTLKERTLYPRSDTISRDDVHFSKVAGFIDVSPDRDRLFVSFTRAGIGLELRPDDGAVLRTYFNAHDVSSRPIHGPERESKVAVFELFGVAYVKE